MKHNGGLSDGNVFWAICSISDELHWIVTQKHTIQKHRRICKSPHEVRRVLRDNIEEIVLHHTTASTCVGY